MLPENITELEHLEREVQAGRPSRSPRNIQSIFPEIAMRDISKVITDIESEHRTPGAKDGRAPKFVHYTDVAVAISMLENTRDASLGDNPTEPTSSYLRMYSTVNFNDPGEGKYLAKVAQDNNQEASNFTAIVWDNSSSVRPEPYQVEHQYAYIASFIQPNDQKAIDIDRVADNLVFWRTYGNEGTGCSLTMVVPPDELHVVKYGDQEANATIEQLRSSINPMLDIAQRLDVKDLLIPIIRKAIERISYLYKSEAYRYEQECRVVETPTTIDTTMQPVFEYSGPPKLGRTKRYINHPKLATNQIFTTGSFITLGPCVQNREDTKEYMEQLIREALLFGPRVQCSKIPYRNMTNR